MMGYDASNGSYSRPQMLRRLAQAAIAADRKISNAEIARRVGVSREAIRLYFEGRWWGKTATDDFEDSVERALEDYSRERDITFPLVMGTPEERYITEVTTRELMRSPV